MQTSQPVLWILFHLRKCGGTTLNGHFKKNLIWDNEFILFDRWGCSYREKHERPPLEKRNEASRQRIKLISGHRVYYGIHKYFNNRDARYMAIMREPASRIVSAYNFDRSRGRVHSDFQSWYSNTYKKKRLNHCVMYYSQRLMPIPVDFRIDIRLSIAKKLFDRCWFVLVTEKLDEDLAYLFRSMNLPDEWENYRVAGEKNNRLRGLEHPMEGEFIKRHYQLDDEMRKCINDDNPYDMALYDYALELNRNRKHLLVDMG